MKEINWGKIASDYGLSVEEFKKELLYGTGSVATMELEESGADAFVFDFSLRGSKYQLTVVKVDGLEEEIH